MAITHERQQGCGTSMSQAMMAQRSGGKNTMQLQQLGQVQMSNMSQANAINVMNFQHNGSGNKKFGNKKKAFHCTFCKNSGHTVIDAIKKHGYPPNHKFKEMNNMIQSGGLSSPVAHSKSSSSVISNLSSDQYESLIYLPKYSDWESNIHKGTRRWIMSHYAAFD
ncbi:hypothetical protein M9H77_27103 [Catharanthus roseus]|uniref:Uncharacterized protein n=1 Tax=Catharanthus roseus TaxID=4058 RepID=A0ACC0ADG0_CATRO|nr:hypothetical protein M9H77_27103 [Catharanthus roseus]